MENTALWTARRQLLRLRNRWRNGLLLREHPVEDAVVAEGEGGGPRGVADFRVLAVHRVWLALWHRRWMIWIGLGSVLAREFGACGCDGFVHRT